MLHAPSLPGLRPTSDRVREAIFDILYSRGGVEGRSVLDLFAGTGALGIEALSRGARRAVFVERDRKAAAAIERNLALVAGDGRPDAQVVRSDAAGYLRRSGEHFDVAFCDPPYAFDGWAGILPLLDAGIVVVESSSAVPLADLYEVTRVYRYGGTLVTLAEGRSGAAAKG
jgi:16S rRNA (guanine966-N2)-methyltransferase